MIKIALGSTSETKKEILSNTLKNIITVEFEIVGVEADSGIPDQPLSEDQTIKGAINRARHALEQVGDANIAIGLEGGLNKVNGSGYYLVCGTAIIDSKDNAPFVGISSQLGLPKEVSKQIENNEEFGEIIREYEKKYLEDSVVQPLIQELISRQNSFEQSIQNAYLSYKNKKHF